MSGASIILSIVCCAHIHSISYSFKLQFYVHPEDRWHPNYRNPGTPLAGTSSETPSNAHSRLPTADALNQADEPTPASSSSVAASPGLPDRPPTPAPTEHADSRPTTPRQQQLGDGFNVVPGPSRRLQRERPFSVAPDPMWNSSLDIQPHEPLATQAPPPPYVLPPTYTEVVPPGQMEVVEEVVHPEFFPAAVEIIEIEPSTLQSPTLDVQEVSISSNTIPRVPATDEEVQNAPSYTFGPSWTFLPNPQAQNTADSEVDTGVEVDFDSDDEHPDPYVGPQVATSTDDEDGDPSDSLDPSILWAEVSADLEDEAGDHVGSGDENPNPESQLSEKARGKKRMREEDYSSDEKDELETMEDLLGGGSSGSGSSSRTSSDRDGQPDRKRVKTDADSDADTRINTDRLEVDDSVLMVARMGLFETLTDAESCRQVKKLKEIERLYRSGRLSLA